MASRSRARSSARRATGRPRAPPPRRRVVGAALLERPWARALAAHPDRTAAGCFALVVLAYLWPVLIGGKILSPISLLYGVPPWQRLAPSDLSSYSNGLLSDIPFADYPWRAFARGLIREGTLPLWNPHVFAGIPFLSNPQTGVFSAFSVPLWILPLNYAIGLAAALKLWVGGFGTYLLCRQLRLGFLPGVLAGVSFMFASINVVWLTHETLPAVAVMLPWMLWLVERIFERGRVGSALWLAVVCAIALGGGHPGMQVHVVAATALYALLRGAIVRRDEPAARGAWLRPLALTGGGLALGLALMAVMLVPEALSSHGTLGTIARQGGHGTIPGSSMPFSASRTPLFPDWWGRPSALSATDAPRTSISPTAAVEVNYNERTFYAGVVALLLAIVALATRGGWRRKAPFAVLMLIGLAIPLHTPGLYTLLEHLPVFKLVQNQRLHFVFELATAVLAAFGLQALLDRPAGDRARFAVLAAALAFGLVAFALIGPSGTDLGHLLRHFATGRDFQSNHVLELTSVTWFLLLAAGVGAALLVARRRPAWGAWVAAALVALALVDMLHFAHGYQPMGPASKVIPPTTPAISYLQEHAREGRFAGLEYALPQDWSMTYGLNDVRGYDPPQPTLRFYRLWLRANPDQGDWEPFEPGTAGAGALHVMSVLGARYVVVAPGVRPPRQRDPAVLALRPAYSGEDAEIFSNAQAAPRAMVAPAVQVVAGEAGARAAIETRGFDPRRTAIVERGEPGAAGLGGAHGSAAVVHESNASVTVRATLDRRGLVVLDDGFTDGWSVRVDGHAAPMLHVDDVVRGVAVPAGSHRIEWTFAVPGLGLGAVVSALALLVLAGGGMLARRAPKKSGAAPKAAPRTTMI
jgi:hypothetical protein